MLFKIVALSLLAAPGAGLLAQEELPVRNLGAGSAVLEGDRLAYSQWESFSGEDLNGDGDTDDEIVHVQNLATGGRAQIRSGVVEFYGPGAVWFQSDSPPLKVSNSIVTGAVIASRNLLT